MVSYKIGGIYGHSTTLREANDLVVVRFKTSTYEIPHTSTDTNKDLSDRVLPINVFPESNVVVYRCLPSMRMTEEQTRNELRSRFKKSNEIKFVGRTLIDENGTIQLYTENAFIKFSDDCKSKECLEIINTAGLKVKRKVSYTQNGYFVELAGAGMKIFKCCSKLLKKAQVDFCHPEIIKARKLKAIGPQQWHLKNKTIKGRKISANVNVEPAWKFTKGKGATIAIIDDGVDIDHPEFKSRGKIVHPKDMISGSANPRPRYESDNHGTACAGIAVGIGKKGCSGVAPEAKLMPIRLRVGLGSQLEAEAFVWAADHGADVISCSWGPADGAWWDPDDPRHTQYIPLPDSTRLAIEYATTHGRGGKGCAIVWAAGNGREPVIFDGYANNQKVIAVAASNDRDHRAIYSDYGSSIWCTFPSGDFGYSLFNHPEPRTAGIWTTDRIGSDGYNDGQNYSNLGVGDTAGDFTATFGGTSAATPGVAGVIALMIANNPALTLNEVKEIIRFSCDKIGGENSYDLNDHSIHYGYGKINAAKAVKNSNIEEEQLELDTMGYVEFSKTGLIDFGEFETVRAGLAKEKFIGIAASITPYAPDIGLSYKLVFNKKGATEWEHENRFLSAKDRRRKCIGFAFKLTGKNKSKYKVIYEGKFYKAKKWLKGHSGQVVGKDEGKGPALIALKVRIDKK